MKKLNALTLFLNIAVLTLAGGCSDSDSKGSSPSEPTGTTSALTSSTADTSTTDPQASVQYPEVKIGNQTWMTKNLDVSTFRNGDPIPQAKTNQEWEEAGKAGKPAWCYYGFDPANGSIYGKLYNWYAVSDPRGFAPKGWHVPADEEWDNLIDHLGGEDEAGGKLKETGNAHWQSPPNTGPTATNSSGFTALPGGFQSLSGKMMQTSGVGYAAHFWSTTEIDGSVDIWGRTINYHSKIERLGGNKDFGYSVRCVKD